jgi:hypothetical protein
VHINPATLPGSILLIKKNKKQGARFKERFIERQNDFRVFRVYSLLFDSRVFVA